MKHDKDVDGGYAWFILAAAFTVMFMVGMMAYSAGVINTALLEEIDADIARTSWVGATLLGTFTLTGPLAGFLTKILGCRISCFSGGILLFVGLVAAAFVSDVTALIATYGIVGGLGMGLALNSSVVVPGYYFRLKRGVAFGVAVSGAGFGMFAGGPLVRCLIEEYKLSGCFLVLGAIQANICVAACILRPSTALISKTREINNKEGITWTKDSDSDSSKPDYEGCSFKKDEIENYNDSIKLEECLDGSKTTYMNCLDKSVIETDSLLTGKLYVQQEEDNPAHNDTQTKEDVCTRPLAGIRSKSCDDSSCSGFAIQTCWRRASRVNINNKYGFLCYNLSVLLWTMGEAACLFHLPNYAASKGSSKTQAASLFTVMGLSSIFSRILAGFAGNDSSIGPLIIHTGLLGLEGTVTLLFPLFSNSYGKQMVFSAVFGMYSGGPNSLMSLITIALVGLKNLPLGIGVGHFCCGFGFLLGPPIASFIYTESGRYDFTFVFAGAVLLFASLFGLMTGFFRGDAEAAPLVDLVKENDVNSPINKSKLHAFDSIYEQWHMIATDKASIWVKCSVLCVMQEGHEHKQAQLHRYMANTHLPPHCSVCKRTLRYGGHAPFLLPCLHTVCSDCLDHEGNTLNCTHCGETHSKQEQIFLKDAVTAAAILTSTAQNNPSEIKCTNKKHCVMAEIWCRDCQVFYCKSCLASHNQMKMARSHDTVGVKSIGEGESLKLTSQCPEHETYTLDLYDTTCEILVCSKCTRTEHKQCTCEDIEGSTLENAKEVLFDSETHVDERLKQVKAASDLLIKESLEAHSRQEIMKTNLKHQFESFRSLLNRREQDLINELESSGCSRLDSFSKVLGVLREKLFAVRNYTSRLSVLGDGAELLTLASSVKTRADECLAEDLPNVQIPRLKVTLDAGQIEELTNQMSRFGSVGTEKPQPERKRRVDYENLEIGHIPVEDETEKTDSVVRQGSLGGSSDSVESQGSLCGSSEDESQYGEYNVSEDTKSEVQLDTSESDIHL